ncbi:hypothetical protein M9Y10_027369 [Tritrichomonas musculus]|uniref:Methyltransferase type 11 domain-containing protein n=1 Tax=Tritrichomonas musculus TaxID=1915356 RepID=A0ABR2H4K9_9EUKA
MNEEEEEALELENSNPQKANYSDASFWDDYYNKNTEQFDWLQSWPNFKKSIPSGITLAGHAINVGCGNSPMSEKLLESGFVRVLNIDFSQVVINQMKNKYENEPKLEWEVGNCTKMDVKDLSFDCIFDKSTLDCLACSDNADTQINSYLNEVYRILKSNGYFILISFAPEITRLRYFKAVSQKLKVISVIQVPKPELANSFHYIYILTKINEL